ncbi:MAG: MarR family winged helix-turn-helix transcriptional regulator [Pigmentiphaga sp.]|uniref:MarR family winged helix-turn-helix transcriptional regulator n=1 Tax=Pigmentiphaga sp. TaxID=1977564 RepID=UPI0029ACD804|nr:MarR family winged helix-turn-helix transcriptional regulator [Pigmentiphaga sp.]MDX3905492.1 MarR family winged helix-turn-helix transcriptional regulator [Pigmentiphaga sp.]
MEKLDAKLARLTMSLGQATRAYKSAADNMAADFGLSQATAWPVLMISRLGDGARPGAVAEALGIEPSSVVRVLDRVIELGLVERREDTTDRRAKSLHLTAAGRECADRIEAALIPFRRKLFAGMPAGDIDACLRVLESLQSAIVRLGQDSDSASSS